MNSLIFALSCLVLLAAQCYAGALYNNVVVHHQPAVTTTVVRPGVAHHSEVAYVPPHGFGYSVQNSKVVHPKTSFLTHHPFAGVHQTDVHHAPIVSTSHSSVQQTRGGHYVHRPVGSTVFY